jgi:hypothetical protein
MPSPRRFRQANCSIYSHKEYARYAAHCLQIVTAAKDQETRSIQREMAAEWLRLADAILHPPTPMK